MEVLLSIKPTFAKKIFEGTKKYEFRKVIFKQKGITKIIVYASAPISKVIGEFEIDTIICDDPSRLWDITHKHAGIDLDYFNLYFSDREKGYAIKIKNAKLYENNRCIKTEFGKFPPQSFVYVEQ
jgi:predicted transcriptional regulator